MVKGQMEKYRLYMVMVLALLLVVGCQDSDEDHAAWLRSIQETKFVQIEPDDYANTMIDICVSNYFEGTALESHRYLFTPLLNALEAVFNLSKVKAAMTLDRRFEDEAGLCIQMGHSWQIESCSFNYPSKSARGEDVILSGRVIFPNHKTKGIGHQVKSLMLYMHGAPPQGKGVSEVFDPYTLRTFFDEAIIEPDGQGLGVNQDKDYYCMASSDVLARQMADCTLAALEVMERHGVTLADDVRTFCVGKSLGGAVALSFAKYYETVASPAFREKVKLSAVYEAIGPVDSEATIRYYGDHPEYNAMLSKSLIFSLAALSTEQLYGYQPKDFVNQSLLNTQVEYKGRKMSYYEAEARYFVNVMGANKDMPNLTKLSDIVASDMMGQDGRLDGTNPKTQTLMRVLAEQNNLSGWQPTIPIYILHCAQDDGIPVEQARKCYNTLSHAGENPHVHYKETTLPAALVPVRNLTGLNLGHIYPGISFTISLIQYEDLSKAFEN